MYLKNILSYVRFWLLLCSFYLRCAQFLSMKNTSRIWSSRTARKRRRWPHRSWRLETSRSFLRSCSSGRWSASWLYRWSRGCTFGLSLPILLKCLCPRYSKSWRVTSSTLKAIWASTGLCRSCCFRLSSASTIYRSYGLTTLWSLSWTLCILYSSTIARFTPKKMAAQKSKSLT